MLSATLKTGLADYNIGAKIRALRLKKKLGLVELGKHTGLSPAMLSKIFCASTRIVRSTCDSPKCSRSVPRNGSN